MAKFGVVPPEPPVLKALDGLAPAFRLKVEAVLAAMPDAVVSESLRTPERSAWLYGMGRDYDDGRGVVTNANAGHSWHSFGLAADMIHRVHGWDATEAWWTTLGGAFEAAGLVWGGRWTTVDKPHGQWAAMRVSPSDHARDLFASAGVEAVWAEVGAL